MELRISNKRASIKIAVITAIVAFSTVFLLTGAIMTQVYGIKPGDPDFYIYTGGDGKELKPYDNFMFNGCLTKIFYQGDPTIIMDTKGLEELGLFYYDPNYCFDVAKETAKLSGYIIDKVETYKSTTTGPFGIEKEQMKITLVKK